MSEEKTPLAIDTSIENQKREKAVTRKVKDFYEQIQFPGYRPMEQDSLIFFRKFSNLIDTLTVEEQPVRVLDAGCGTGNTSLALSAQFENVEFFGVDISSASILRAQKSAEEKQLSNVQFYEWNLLDSLKHEEKFNIIMCFGVLHHTAQMQKVLNNLKTSLKKNGTLFLWVYGEYGRYRHSLNLKLLSMLLDAVPENDNRIDLAREFILKTGNGMAVKDLLGNRYDDPLLSEFFTNPTWIADQFLNPNELTLNMRDLLTLTKNADLKITEWIGVGKDVSTLFNSPELEKRFNLLSAEQQMIALDLLLKFDRYFLILRQS